MKRVLFGMEAMTQSRLTAATRDVAISDQSNDQVLEEHATTAVDNIIYHDGWIFLSILAMIMLIMGMIVG